MLLSTPKGVGEGARLRLKYTLDGEENSGGVKILVGLYLEHQKDPGPGKCTKLEALSVLTGMRAEIDPLCSLHCKERCDFQSSRWPLLVGLDLPVKQVLKCVLFFLDR